MQRPFPLVRSAVLGVVGTVLLASPGAAYAAPSDVQRLDEIAALIDQAVQATEPTSTDLLNAMVGELRRRSKDIAAQNGLPETVNLDSSEFTRQLRARIEGPLQQALGQRRSQRSRQLYALLAEIAQQEEAHLQVAEYLHTDTFGAYAKEALAAVEAKRQAARDAERKKAAEARGARPMNDAERYEEARQAALEAARVDNDVRARRLEERFRRTVWAAQGDGDLRLLPTEATLISDRCGPGSNNGVADAGEWITVSIPVLNAGRVPWFSSSTWIRADNECAWTGNAREVELPELRPGERANLAFRFYVSDQCADRSRLAFNFEIRDTQQSASRSLNIGLGVLISNVGAGALREPRVDRDIPGSSDPTNKAAELLLPLEEVEFSAGFANSRSGAAQAMQAWGWSQDIRPVFAESTYEIGFPMIPVLGSPTSAFDPHDDVDVRVVGKDEYKKVMGRISTDRRWARAEQAGGVAVVETVVEYPAPEGEWLPPGKVKLDPKPVEPPPPPPPLSAAEALVLFKSHVQVQARDVAPVDGALASATSTIFDATVDEDAFRLAWCRATTVRVQGAPDPCDPKACAEPPPPPKPIEVPAPAFSQPVSYVYRHYLWVPERWEPPEPEREPEPEAEPEVERPEVDVERRAPPPRPEPEALPVLVGLGVELGGSRTVSDEITGIDLAFGTTSEPHLFGEFAYGTAARLHLRAGASLGADAAVQSPGLSASAWNAGLGGGYAWRFDSVEVEPLVMLGLRSVTVKGDFDGGGSGSVGLMAVYLEPGLVGRWYATPNFGIWAGVDYRAELAYAGFAGVTTRIYDNSGVKLQFGVSGHF